VRAVLVHWPVGRRVFLGLSAVMFCLAVAGAAGIGGLALVQSAFDDYRSGARELADADRTKLVLSDYLGAAKEYVARNSDERRRMVDGRFAATRDTLSAVAASAPPGDFADAAARTGTALEDFHDAFGTVGDMRTERNAVIAGEIVAPAAEAADALASLADGAGPSAVAARDAAIRLLAARAAAADFVNALAPDDLAFARREIGAAIALVQTGGLAPAAPAVERLGAGLDRLADVVAAEAEATAIFFGARQETVAEAVEAMAEAARAHEAKAVDTFAATKSSIAVTVSAIVAVSIALAALVGRALSRSIVRPVREMTVAMKAISAGDYERAVPHAERGDEVGEMAHAVEIFRQTSVKGRLQADRIAADQAARQRQDEINQMIAMFGKSMDAILRGFNGSADGMAGLAGNMETVSAETEEKASRVAEAAVRIQESIQTIATAAQELAASVGEVGDQAGRTSAMSKVVRKAADGAEEDVRRLVDAVRHITSVTTLIRDISGQTNLLALNATIEAARAGEAGRGFAVVAAEVKQLADQTSAATDRIAEQLAGVESLSGGASAAMERIRDALAELDEVAAAMAGAVTEQHGATGEIASAANRCLDEVGEVTAEVDSVHGAAEASRGEAGKVREASNTLARDARDLSVEVRGFLEGIGDPRVRESVTKRNVEIAATVLAAGQSTPVTIVRMSPAAAELTGRLDVAPGERITVRIPGLGDVRGRVADRSDRRVSVQFPMDIESLNQREHFLVRHDDDAPPLAKAA